MSPKLMKTGAAVAVVVLGSYWYWSPFVAIHKMRAAAEKKDADTFNEYVEYPRLRESLKGQMSAMLGEKMAGASGGSNAEMAGAVFGSALVMAMADRLIDGMVRPETVMRVMDEARVMPGPVKRKAEQPQQGQQGQSAPKEERVRWAYERKSVDKLIAYPESEPEDKRVSVVFERFGLISWKLTEVRLPLGTK